MLASHPPSIATPPVHLHSSSAQTRPKAPDVPLPSMAQVELSQTLAESFNALADEVQTLADRKTVLEHKLRFAHEQVRFFTSIFSS